MFFMPIQAIIHFPIRLYDDFNDEEEGSDGLKDLDAYSIGTTLLDDALRTKKKDPVSFTLPWLGKLAPTKLIVELADRTVKCPKGIAENVLVGIDKFVFPIDFIVLDMPEDIKTPLILGRLFLSTAHAKIDVLRERMKLDLDARLIGEALILNRSSDLLYGDYIELNDLNEPLELRRNQVDDLEPTIVEGEVVDEPMMDIVKTRCDNEIIDGLNEYPSYEHVNANFFPLFSINVMSIKFYNSIMKDKVEYKGRNVVGAFMKVPIFVGNYSVMADFVVVENMDSYRNDGMGDIIVRRPFYRDACVKERRFDGMITIYNGNDSVTYQMAQSHPRFKHLTITQCYKMRPLLKVSGHDELKGISHPYKKLKGFYKGILNLGPEYIKNKKVEEWLTCGHVSVHEMEW
ncbi:homeodomain-like protein [Tanacetum coccineum]